MSLKSLISRIGVGIFADTSDYSKGLKRAESMTDKFGKSMAGKLVTAAATIGTAMAGFAGFGKLKELAELGGQMERAEERFVSFAGSVSRSIEMMDAFQRGSGGVVDKMTAMAQASRLLQMGLVQTPDEMEKIVEMATRLGKQTDDVSTRMEDFGALLANQSMPRLDNFGISSGRVRQRIEELQKAMPGMTRETAFLQAVMEEGAISLEKLGERADDTLTSLEQLASAYTNLKIAIGKAIAPSMAFIARDAASWLDSTEKTGDEMADIADLFSGFIKLIYMSTAGLTATFKIMAGALAGIAAMILAIPALFGSAAATAAAESLLESAAEFGKGALDDIDKATAKAKALDDLIEKMRKNAEKPIINIPKNLYADIAAGIESLVSGIEVTLTFKPLKSSDMVDFLQSAFDEMNSFTAPDAFNPDNVQAAEKGSQEAARLIADIQRGTVDANERTAKNTADIYALQQQQLDFWRAQAGQPTSIVIQ
jgi:hypothetical protein